MKSRLILLSAVLSVMCGCAAALPSAGPGFFMTDATEGISINNGVQITKTGKACELNILGIVSAGNASMSAAMKKTEITQVATVDRSFFSVLGIYAKACTIVAGN